MGYLVESKRKSTTIRSYISGMKAVLADLGVDLREDRYLLTSLVRVCKLNNDVIQAKIPIQNKLFHLIIDSCNEWFHQKGQNYLALLYSAMFSSAYYGILRISEVTTSEHPVKAVDVHVAENKNKFLFILCTSKTHGLGDKPQMIRIKGSARSLDHNCPFKILQRFVAVHPSCRTPATEPFFVYADRSPVNAAQARSILKLLIRILGLNNKLYSFHGFRSGRLTDLYEWGIAVSTIKKLGRWKSNMVYTYL